MLKSRDAPGADPGARRREDGARRVHIANMDTPGSAFSSPRAVTSDKWPPRNPEIRPDTLPEVVYVNLEQTKNEIENRLEQLRAMDNSIKINVALAKFSPVGIDTQEDYLALKKIMEYKS